MIVRDAQQEDLAKVLEIEKLSFADPWNNDFLEKVSKDIFLVSGEQEVHGFIIAGCCHRNISATILKVAVHPEHRRQGVATNLLNQLIVTLKNRQIVEVDVVVDIAWKPAISLYKKVGLEIVSTITQISNDTNFYEMKLKLSPDC
jgi:ribosomal-protein-alanine N-acetyltransferase